MTQSRVSPSTFPLGRGALLLAGSILASSPALAAGSDAAGGTKIEEIVVTAQKRSENLQKVPMAVQALDTKTLSQLNASNFSDFAKFLPSVQFQTAAPGVTILYMRGVSDGGNGNHSGPAPSVGAYLDEQPLTTIGGTLDVHLFDIARVEVLPGPQGTLYGASSEAGTIKYVTNKPTTSKFEAGFQAEVNGVAHGAMGDIFDGFVNVPLNDKAAVRVVGFYERDGGYIDNVHGTRPFATSGAAIDNAGLVKNHFNPNETFGGRIALKYDINDRWTVMPTVIAQDSRANGVYGYNPAVGDLKVNRFQPDSDHDRWVQAAMTITGKIGRYDLTYSGGYFNRAVDTLTDYTDYSVAYDQVYGSGAYWTDNAGNPLAKPAQEIIGRDRFEKGSNEIRLASPASDRLRFLIGGFQERQTHWIIQDYVIQGFGSQIAVTGWPNTIWLTNQNRIDRDEAAFGELSYDVTQKLTVTGGVRYYHYDNTLVGFYGYSAGFSSHTGEAKCKPGLTFRNAPCVNLSKPDSTGDGETWKANLTYRIDDDRMVYFTYSTGYRPGGVNRSGTFGAYQPDSLTNFELGWKSTWFDRSLVFNGAAYYEDFSNFQFAFLGPNSLTIIQNAPSARILGVESNVTWRATHALTFSGAASFNDAILSKNFCGTDQSTGLLIPTCPDSQALALHGQQLAYTPKFKISGTARYAFPLLGWDAHAQASINYQTRRLPAVFDSDIGNLGVMPDFATVDLSFGVEKDKSFAELFIKNAFDARGQLNRYTPCTTSVCAPAYPGVPPAVYVVPTQPLTFGLKFGRNF